MDIYIFNIKDIDDGYDIKNLLPYVNEEKQKRILRFKFMEDKKRSLIGDIITRINICKRLSCNNEDIKYKFNEYGKPSFKDLYFNISHSGDYVAVAIGDKEVGIDIEKIDKIEFDSIAKRYFHSSEYSWINDHNEREKKLCFYKLWTLKESYVKYVGKGMKIKFNSFYFSIDDKNNITINEDLGIVFKNYNVDNEYMLSICSEEEDVTLHRVDFKYILENLNK